MSHRTLPALAAASRTIDTGAAQIEVFVGSKLHKIDLQLRVAFHTAGKHVLVRDVRCKLGFLTDSRLDIKHEKPPASDSRAMPSTYLLTGGSDLWTAGLIFLIELGFKAVRAENQAFRPRRRATHLLADGLQRHPGISLDDDFVVHVSYNSAAAKRLHGVAQDVAADALDDIFHELATKTINPQAQP